MSGRTSIAGLLTLSLLWAGNVHAQNDLSDSLRFTIRKEYRPVARDAKRITDEPKYQFETVKPPVMKYTVLPKRIDTDLVLDPIGAAKLANEPLAKLYAGHAKVGFGNYTMPYAEVNYGTLRNKTLQASGYGRYHGSFAHRDGKPFGFTDLDIGGNIKYLLKKRTARAAVHYAHDRVYRYGYSMPDTILKDSQLLQYYHRVGVDLDLRSTDILNPKLFNVAAIGYHMTTDRFKSTEHALNMNLGAAFKIKKSYLSVNAELAYFKNQMPSLSANNVIFNFGPEFRVMKPRWSVTIGAYLGLDAVDRPTSVIVYPKLDAHYMLVKDIMRVYLKAGGGVKRNGLDGLSATNPYMNTDQQFVNSLQRLHLEGGFKGSIIKGLGFDLGVSESIISAAPFFVNDVEPNGQFMVLYQNVNILGLNGELSYLSGEKLQVALRANYRFFFMSGDDAYSQPWHESPLRITLSGRYTFLKKFNVRAGLFVNGPRKALDYTSDLTGIYPITVSLKWYLDANLGAEYRIKDWVSVFADVRNIGGMRYEAWYRYPVQRTSIMAGLNFFF